MIKFDSRVILIAIFSVLLSGCASSGVTDHEESSSADTWKHANDAYKNGNWERAESLYQKITENFPDDSEAYFRLGVSAYRQGKLKLAEESFSKVILLKPDNTKASFNLGVIQLNRAYTLFLECARNAKTEKQRSKYIKLAQSIAELQWISGQ